MLASYNLHDAYLEIVRFEGDDLSSFYLDALKDRLYSSAADAPRRRSAQSAIWYIFEHLVTLLAPLLSFTAEEAWQSVPPALRADRASVFDLTFALSKHDDPAARDLWTQIKTLRAQVAANGEIRDFEAKATLVAGAALYARLAPLGDNLREALVVSELALGQLDGGSAALLTLERSTGEKCQRCWKYLPLGTDPNHPSLCTPCTQIIHDNEEHDSTTSP
jgi:isoleucyl-tRNA synthetase